MRSKLVRIGNSKGIRLPKALLQAAGLEDAVDLRVEDGKLVIRPVSRRKHPRAGWDEAFARMAERGDDKLLDAEAVHRETEWERDQWTW